MEYQLKGRDGELKIGDIVYSEEEAGYPNNTSLYAVVSCGLFAGAAHFETDMEEVKIFSHKCMELCENGRGQAFLKAAYDDTCIYIESLMGGEIGVSGELFEKACAMGVRFQYRVTAEELKAFAQPLCRDYGQEA